VFSGKDRLGPLAFLPTRRPDADISMALVLAAKPRGEHSLPFVCAIVEA
jgi:hypothetical protein